MTKPIMEFYKNLPHCVGYPTCDGDLVGTKHVKTCPLFKRKELSIVEFAEAWAKSETDRADRAEREKESWRTSYQAHWKALQESYGEIRRKNTALQEIIDEADQSNGGKGAQLPIVLWIKKLAESALSVESSKMSSLAALLKVIKVWMETASGPTYTKFSHPDLNVQVTIKGYKKLILERTFKKDV